MIELKQIEKPDLKYKSILWAGITNSIPKLSDRLYLGSDRTIKQTVLESNKYPILLTWETSDGDKKFAVINGTKEINKR